MYHDLHGADLDALTAADTVLLADHVNAGLGVLRDGTGLADLFALTALDAGHGLGASALSHDLDAGQVFVELLEEGSGTGTNALQASHTFHIFLNSELLHN